MYNFNLLYSGLIRTKPNIWNEIAQKRTMKVNFHQTKVLNICKYISAICVFVLLYDSDRYFATAFCDACGMLLIKYYCCQLSTLYTPPLASAHAIIRI